MTTQKKKMQDLAEKVAMMEPKSVRTLIFAADVLLARDQMEHSEKKPASCTTSMS